MEKMLFKELEWGINLSTNTIFLTYDIDVDALYHVCTRMDALKKYNKGRDINLIISSYGGDVYSMMGIIDYIKNLEVKVNTICYGAAMSATAVILACGTGVRSMSENSTVMIHEGSAFEVGKISDVLKTSDHLKLLHKSINEILGEVTEKPKVFWNRISKTDTYLTSEQCLKYGVIDEII